MKIKEIMIKNPDVLKPSDKIKKAAEVFKKGADGIPVLDDSGKIIGIVTKTRIIDAYIKGLSPEIPLSEIMVTDVLTINENFSAEKAWEYPVSSIPVVNDEGQLVGILTRTNLVKGYYRDLQAVKKLNKELEAIIESSYDGFYITDGNAVTLRINSAYTRITGIKPEEVIGRSMYELVDKGLYSESVTLRVLKEKKPVTIMHDVKTGKRLLITGNPVFNENGQIVRVVTNARDITELINLKKKLEESQELTQRYHLELQQLRKQQKDIGEIVVKSPEMKKVVEMAAKVSDVDSTVLISGESGVGKEIIAKIIHNTGKRNSGPFIKVNCAAIPDTLLESELFGYEQGSFTGARRDGKPGMFELAQNGTIFLDEVGELPLHLQPKLLRVIQDKEIIRLGGSRPIKLDVRIIAATNKDLAKMVEEGKFREDLYYRLNVVPIFILPLRERKSDIFPLIMHFLNKFNQKYGLNKKLATDTVDLLTEYSWPGNVRELENVVERLVVTVNEDIIKPHHLPSNIVGNSSFNERFPWRFANDVVSLKDAVAYVEKEMIFRALRKYKTTRRAAKALKINQSTVVRKAQKYNINIK